MRICFPTKNLAGLDSMVFGHFGSAPGFVIVDTDTGQFEQIVNGDSHHAHGMCQPLKALQGRRVDAVVVGGIGMGALVKLQAEGVRVFRGVEATIHEHLQMMAGGKLPILTPEHTCRGHQGGGGCAHSH